LTYRKPRVVTKAEHEELIHPCGIKPAGADCDHCMREQWIACFRDHIMDINIPAGVDVDAYLQLYWDSIPWCFNLPRWKRWLFSLAAKLLPRSYKTGVS